MIVSLNPGHSESDPGAIGPTGLHEAEVNAAVAELIASRAGDGVVYAVERQVPGTKGLGRFLLALRENPPLVLVSLHCDAYPWQPGRCIHRATVYYWQGDKDTERRNASHRLAVICREAARRPNGYASDAMVRPAPYLRRDKNGAPYPFVPGILKGTAKGAVALIEMGFLSDPHVEGQMKRPEWRQAAAIAIDRGIRQFVATGEIKEE